MDCNAMPRRAMSINDVSGEMTSTSIPQPSARPLFTMAFLGIEGQEITSCKFCVNN